MGRSQVERNRTHGRPGGKGRGRGRGQGRGGNSTNNNNKQKAKNLELGSNAFRYEKHKEKQLNDQQNYYENEASSMMILDSYSQNEFGPSHYSIARDFDHGDDGNFDDTITQMKTMNMDTGTEIDVALLSKCLKDDHDLNYLRFGDIHDEEESRMIEMFRKRFYDGSDEKDTRMTIAEQRALGGTIGTGITTDGDCGVIQEEKEEINEKRTDGNDKDETQESNASGNDDEENLEDWLDDMIM